MNMPLYYERLVKLYRKKDKLLKDINNATWDDAFTQQPECLAKERSKLVKELDDLNDTIEYTNTLDDTNVDIEGKLK